MTSCPRSAAVAAAMSPAGPAPTTTTRPGVFAFGTAGMEASRPESGLRAQVMGIILSALPTQPCPQATQGQISSLRPAAYFSTRCESAMSARPMMAKSARPSRTTRSAVSASEIRPVSMTRTLSPSASLTAALVAAFHALGIQVGGVISSKQHCMPAVMSKALTPASVRVRHSSTVVPRSIPFPVGTSSTEVWR